MYGDTRLPARFWDKVVIEGACWRWTAATFPNGYGCFGYWQGRHSARAHRVAYEALVERVPDGLVLDHLCRNRWCVNPAHLEAVTVRENILRGVGLSAENARKVECKNGHRLTGSNLRVSVAGTRYCATCKADYQRARRAAGRR